MSVIMVGPSSPRAALEREVAKMERVALEFQKRDPDGMQSHRDHRKMLRQDHIAAALTLLGFGCGAIAAALFGWWAGGVVLAAFIVPYIVLCGQRVVGSRRARAAQLRAFEQAKTGDPRARINGRF